MNALRFAEPGWAYALWALVALAVWLAWRERRGVQALDRMVSASLQDRLVRRPGTGARWSRLALLLLAAAFAVLALMRPQWGMRRISTPRVGAELMVCLDVSRSMLAEDVAPNRLERAKAEIADLLGFLDGNQVGLIAFAGRATVLSPLTPDFGFLRLALDEAGSHSVTRGGTRLEEPIRKALAGFGRAGDAARAILLITDGEDLGSFPLDAARTAAERGVQIIAIGFGDEAGSEILVTDPRTGARTRLRDAEGRVVRSRLDGDLLRELALVTRGVYVPAGTGVLDLESIYQEHIGRLMRGRLEARSRTVYDELYPWAVFLALACLVASAGAAATTRRGIAGIAPFVLALAVGTTAPATTQTSAREAPATREEDPRALYNEGVAALQDGRLDEARQAFRTARREARDDGDLRFRAASNLGWVLARQAEGMAESEPDAALRQLTEAAAWLREAVGLRPEAEDVRENLEVVLRRSLLLADRLAREREGGIEKRLSALADQQRGLMSGIAALLEVRGEASRPDALEQVRRLFQARATEQRGILSDADLLSMDVGRELGALESRAESERTRRDAVRAVQLAQALQHLHRARERMGQARGQLRRREGERAYRRAAGARDELKRSLDPLRSPEAILGDLVREARGRIEESALLARRAGAPASEAARLAPWLSERGAADRNRTLTERARELAARLEAGLSRGGAAEDPAALRANRAMGEALPFLEEAVRHFEAAGNHLDSAAFGDAGESQRAGGRALAEARERFLGLRGLIELAYATQRELATGLGPSADPIPEAHMEAARVRQRANLARTRRLEDRLREERAWLEREPAPGAPATDPGDATAVRERERLDHAGPLVDAAIEAMQHADRALAVRERARAGAASEAAVEPLSELRRLFFSIAERVQELLSEQVEIGDQTEDAFALPRASDAETDALGDRQAELAQRSEAAAFDLEALSRETGAGIVQSGRSGDTAQRLRVAAEHVLQAQEAMGRAARRLQSGTVAGSEVREPQQTAELELREALAALQPPAPETPPQSDDAQAGAGAGSPRPPVAGQRLDPAQILQQVRDREAERRRERRRRTRLPSEPVEKDW